MFRIPNFLLNQKCQIKVYLGNTATGSSYGSATTYKCRFEYMSSRTQQPNNQEKAITARVFLPASANVNEYAELIYDGITFKVRKVYKQYALNSISHYMVEVI